MTNYKLSVPKPCNENWDAMTPDAKGRFCGLCEKTVVDFTGMPGTEISGYLLANAGKKVCGRFNTEQLESKPFIPQIPRSVLFSQTSFRKMFLLALLVTMGTTLFSCKDHNDNDMTLGEPAIVDDTEQVDTLSQKKEMITGKVENPDSLVKAGKILPPPSVDKYIVKSAIVGEVAPSFDTILPPPPPVEVHEAPKSHVKRSAN